MILEAEEPKSPDWTVGRRVEIPAFGGSQRLGRWNEPSCEKKRREKQGVCFGRGLWGRATGAASGRDGQRRQMMRHDQGPALNKREATI